MNDREYIFSFIKKIRSKMNTAIMIRQIMNGLISFIEDQGISVYEVQNIQYAKKIRCKLGVRLAEINLFYGKRGFRPVQSPRTGTSQELNEIVEEIIKVYLHDNI